jgi:hypothetical protein
MNLLRFAFTGLAAESQTQLRNVHRAHQDRAVHRLLQRNHGKALPMDHDRKAARRLNENESLIFARLYQCVVSTVKSTVEAEK